MSRLFAAVQVSIPRRLHRRPLPGCLLVGAVVLAGCGGGTRATHAETEGIYVSAGPLTYQVQISRQLNPRNVEDGAYLRGLSPAQAKLSKSETWFGVWVRVSNETKKTYNTAKDFWIVDTKDSIYRPVALPAANPFAYRPKVLGAGHIAPTPNSVAGEGAVQGMLLLFKLPLSSFENRPLELHIVSPSQQQATVTLDV